MEYRIAPKSVVGDRVRAKRLAMDITQAVLAARVGVSRNAIGDVETGEKMPSPATAAKLCNVFGMTLNELYLYRTYDETIIFHGDIVDTMGRRVSS